MGPILSIIGIFIWSLASTIVTSHVFDLLIYETHIGPYLTLSLVIFTTLKAYSPRLLVLVTLGTIFMILDLILVLPLMMFLFVLLKWSFIITSGTTKIDFVCTIYQLLCPLNHKRFVHHFSIHGQFER